MRYLKTALHPSIQQIQKPLHYYPQILRESLIYYSLDETTSIGAAPNIIANWEQDGDNTWTVPIGLGISKTIQMGKVPVRFGFEVHYSVITPDDTPGAEWDFRLYVIPAVPAALFSRLQ